MPVTEGAVRAFLTDRFGDETQDVSPVRRQGEWSRAFSFRRGTAHYIARFSALREDFDKDQVAARYRASGLPTPVILEVGAALGGFYAISERVAGGYLDELDERGMRGVLPALFAALDAARSIDLSEASGYGGWDRYGTAPFANWRDWLLDIATDRPTRLGPSRRAPLEASPAGTAAFDEGFARMRELVERCPEAKHVVHQDLLNYNVLVTGDRVAAVLDWGSSVYGDFLYDIAWLSFWWPWFPAWADIDIVEKAARHYRSIGLTVPAFAERLRCYELHIGLDGQTYSAARQDWTHLGATVHRTLELARRPLP
jgi:hygromycin-B 4-O-kinase